MGLTNPVSDNIGIEYPVIWILELGIQICILKTGYPVLETEDLYPDRDVRTRYSDLGTEALHPEYWKQVPRYIT